MVKPPEFSTTPKVLHFLATTVTHAEHARDKLGAKYGNAFAAACFTAGHEAGKHGLLTEEEIKSGAYMVMFPEVLAQAAAELNKRDEDNG